LKLAVLGATGGVGREILSQALAAGHTVTAVVRNPSELPAEVNVVRQDLATPDVEVLAAALRDVDAVFSAVGPHRAAQAGIATRATAAVIRAMDGSDGQRLVVISAAPVGVVPSAHRPRPPRHDPGDDPLMRYLLSPLVRRIFSRVYTDLAAMEDMLRNGNLDWTAIRPPLLTNGPLTGTYRTAVDRNPTCRLSGALTPLPQPSHQTGATAATEREHGADLADGLSDGATNGCLDLISEPTDL
jgi:nucleoside-diphosphate-sugar epimerase